MKKYQTPKIDCEAFDTQEIMLGFGTSANVGAENEVPDGQN